MSNRALTADVICKEALLMLENELGVLNTFYRAHEDEFTSEVNGYKKGATVSIRRPADFVVRTGAVMNTQDVLEGKVALTVDKQVGVDFQFSSTDLTLSISDLSERVIKPAMSTIVNEVARDCFDTFYKGVYNWVGTPGQVINAFTDFSKGPERLDEMAVPTSQRMAALSPADHWGMLGQQTALYIQGAANSAYRDANLGMIAGVDTYMSQVVPTHTNGAADSTSALTDGNSQEVTYDTAKDTWTQTLLTDGWSTSTVLKAGTVITIAGVYMVNPKTKASTGIEQNFVVMADITTDGISSNNSDFVISPPIITSGPHQTVTYSGNFDGKQITVKGSISTSYKQNLVYHKNSFALAMVPLEMPQGATNGARRSYKGLSARVIPIYDGINDVSKWRLDMLYGRKVIDPRLATRLSGT